MAFAFTASHPLISAAVAVPVVYLVAVALGRWLKHSQRVPLGALYQLFAIVLALWLPAMFTGVDFPHRAESLRWLGAAAALLGAVFGMALMHRYFWEGYFVRTQQMQAPKFLRQIVTLVLFVAAGLVVLQVILEKDISAALTASGMVAVVLGFAMQETLANIISGIALEIGKPFKTGDWLIVEKQHAEVVEVNWRSTRLRTNDDIYLDIPNKTIVGATITNLTHPTRQHAIRIHVGFDYKTPPNFVKDCMMRAAASAPGVLPHPPPKVFLKDFGDSAIIYEIKFTMENEAAFNDICDAIRTNIWYEAQRSGINIPFPIRTLKIERPRPQYEDALAAARMAVAQQPILQLLDQEQIDKLLMHARLLRFGRSEKVIAQGTNGDSMFILLSGEAQVRVRAGDTETQVATLRHGDAFGEMSLLTGEPRSATVVAHTDCEMWEIDKATLGEILQENAALVQRLGEMLAHRRMENEGVIGKLAGSHDVEKQREAYTQGFLKKLSAFFRLCRSCGRARVGRRGRRRIFLRRGRRSYAAVATVSLRPLKLMPFSFLSTSFTCSSATSTNVSRGWMRIAPMASFGIRVTPAITPTMSPG